MYEGNGQPDGLARIVEDLRAELGKQAEIVAAAERTLADAKRTLADAKRNPARIQKAIDTLTGGRKPDPKPSGKKKGWTIGEEKVAQALETLRTMTEPVSKNELAKAMGASNETARRSMERLREQGVVRYVGTEPRGRNNQRVEVYALMPEHANAG